MDNEEDGFCNPGSLKRRLRLRKDFKESADNKTYISGDSDNKHKDNNTVGIPQSPCNDDSILDFKSPKKIHLVQPKNINSKKSLNKAKQKGPRAKIQIINNRKKRENKSLLDIKRDTQSLIESSFFKTEKNIDLPQSSTNIKTAHVCPLCFKNFKDEDSQAVHMKNCAIKNNVSTKKLLDVVELQERQAAERKSLGLLTAPILQDKKKPSSRKITPQDDSDLQLALALSKSLYEKEEMETWDEAEIATISPSSLPNSNKECFQGTTLQSFGFTSNRNISPTNNFPASKIKRRRIIGPTILQSRTAVEREHILTERVAEILMGYQDFTQTFQEKKNASVKEKIVIKNVLLQGLHKTEDTLWDRTNLTSTQNLFYVKQLAPHITSLIKKETINKEQNDINLINYLNINNEKLENKEMQEIKEEQAANAADNSEESTTLNAIKACCEEKRFLDALATSWGNILNDSSASDIIIFVKNNRHIWTHKLVFYVRCTNILLDVVSNDTEFFTAKEKICWVDIEYDVALVFLEFVYCGIIDRYSKMLDSDTTLYGIRSLARKYKIKDLFTYLRQRRSKPNLTEVNSNNICEEASSISEFKKFNFNTPNRMCHDSKNIQHFQETLLQDVNDSSTSICVSAENSYVLQDEKSILLKSPEKVSLKNNVFDRETSVSPDMFDDTFNITRFNDKSIKRSQDHEDSNINMLLSLIKQDVDIHSQKSLIRETHNTEYSEPDKYMSILEKVQDVMEISSESDSNSVEPFANDSHKNSSIDTLQSNEPKSIKNSTSLDIAKQKSDLTLLVEKIQSKRANANSDSDSDLDITIHSIQMSPMRRFNPFSINEHGKSNNEASGSYDDNIKQSAKTMKKLGHLSIIEQRMQSYSNKNPEFYPRPSDEQEYEQDTQTNSLTTSSPERVIESSHNDTEILTEKFTSTKDINTFEQITITPKICSPDNKTANQSYSESMCDLEADDKEISMYSQYMRSHRDNSIGKYRTAIKKNKPDNLSSTSISSDSLDKNSDTDETDEAPPRSILMQKDTDGTISDTEIESTFSSPIVLQEDNREDSNSIFAQQFKQKIKCNKQNAEIKESDQVEIDEFSRAATTSLEDKKYTSSATKLDRDKFNISQNKEASDNEDFNMIFTQTKSRLDELCGRTINDHEKELASSPVTVSSSPDFLNVENPLAGIAHCSKHIPETSNNKLKSTKFSFNFEDDIYLANVDVDKYEKRHFLEKSQSANVLNITEFNKKNNARSNKNKHENVTDDNVTVDNIPVCADIDRNAISLTQDSTSIRKLKKKSLSEGQIDINRLRNQDTRSIGTSIQLQCNYIQSIGHVKTAVKIIDKDVTPPPDYNGMKTPELHREMERYGLKIQKRDRAVKLLTHIYNELHPIVPVTAITAARQEVTEISSDEDQGPPLKRRNTNSSDLDKSNNTGDSNDEFTCSQDSNASTNFVKDTISKEMEFYETESLPALENSLDIKEAFTKLINTDKDLYNKILQYEPVNIEQLHITLRAHGFKCKLSNLMSFLDEQCITFCVPEQNFRSRTRKKT